MSEEMLPAEGFEEEENDDEEGHMENEKESGKENVKLLIEDEGDDLEWFMDKEFGEYGTKHVAIDRATLKAIARRSTSVKILRFLLGHKERDFSCKEVHKILAIPYMTVNYALRKLVKAGILERVIPHAVDVRNKCYRIVNLKIVDAIIKLHDSLTSYKLAKLLPYDFVSLGKLKGNAEFLELCKKNKLTTDEGLELLKSNSRKVELIYRKDSSYYDVPPRLVGFRRKEQ